MTRIVPDVNIIISALFWKGEPYKIISKGLKGEYVLLTSPAIIDELAGKLRSKFQFPEEKLEELINIMLTLFHVVNPATSLNVVRDKSDNKIIECAVDGKADFIITGDADLLELKEFTGIRIITPREFFKRMKE